MANGDDKVKVTMPDGSTWNIPKSKLPAAQARGAKPLEVAPTAQPESTLAKVGRGAALGTFAGLGLPEVQKTKDFPGALVKSLLPHDLSELDPTFGPLVKLIRGIQGGVVAPGKEVVQGIQQKDPEMIAHGGAQLTTEAAMALLGKEKGVEIGEAIAKVPKRAAREMMGLSDKDIAPQIAESHEKVNQAHQKFQEQLAEHAEKVDQATKKVSDKIADVQQKKIQASARETAAETKQAALTTKRGPVRQRIENMGEAASENVQLVDKKVRALEGAKWNEFTKGLKGAQVDWTPSQKAVVDAQQNILGGVPENITIFNQILKETGDDILADASVFKGGGTPRGVDVKDFMRTMDPKAQARLLQELKDEGIPPLETGAPVEGIKIPIDKARAFYTKLGQKIASVDMPNNVTRALRYVQDAGDAEITRTIAKTGGKEAVQTYRQLKSNWRDYMNTFYDKDSPVRKLKEGKDPNDRLNPIVGDEGERAIALLGKYRSLGADVQALGKIRATFKALKELPASGGKAPTGQIEAPKIPKPPEAPTEKPLTAEQARREKMASEAKSRAHAPTRWEIMFPPLLAYKMAIKKAMQSPRITDWLAGETPPAPLPPRAP
jgi:hypothetical protein